MYIYIVTIHMCWIDDPYQERLYLTPTWKWLHCFVWRSFREKTQTTISWRGGRASWKHYSTPLRWKRPSRRWWDSVNLEPKTWLSLSLSLSLSLPLLHSSGVSQLQSSRSKRLQSNWLHQWTVSKWTGQCHKILNPGGLSLMLRDRDGGSGII